MRLALGQNQVKAHDPGEKVARPPWLLKVIGARAHNIQERLVVGDQEIRAIEDIAEVDKAFVGDGSDPFESKMSTPHRIVRLLACAATKHHCCLSIAQPAT